MTLRLYNTLTRRKEAFEPIDPANVRMYVCGPTVYDVAHIGNARPVIVFDLLFRLLRHLYGADHVTYARNITDVDDKIIARAAEEGVAIDALTARTTEQFHEDVAALGCLAPTREPRATDHIGDMIAMIERLIATGNAYEAEGHVLFHVPSMPDYGKLAKKSLDEMVEGARVEVAPYKRDPMDFVLWKPARDGEPGWDSPWGQGRPGWHIECSAMSAAHLGEVFDIHGGGIDLVFPHHENEVAQSRCAHGTEVMARYWLHNGFLQVEGQKMSKSLGNFVTVPDLLHSDQFGGRPWPGDVIRLAMLMVHYTKPLNWTVRRLQEAESILKRWRRRLEGINLEPAEPDDRFIAALSDDLNTAGAIDRLHELFRLRGFWAHPDDPEEDREAAFGFGAGQTGFASEEETRKAASVAAATLAFLGIDASPVRPHDPRVDALVDAREEARKRKDFAEADRIRDELAEMGIALKDGPEGTSWEIAR